MEDLIKHIKRIRHANFNHEGRNFIPAAELEDILSESSVMPSLLHLGVPAGEIQGLCHSILQGARKCFAILILIGRGDAISSFFRHDSLQQSHPDDRLPYTVDALQKILQVDASSLDIKEFIEKQSYIAIPMLREHTVYRQFDDHVILPFVHEECVGGGSSATAYKVTIHPKCHYLPIIHDQVIRKELRPQANQDLTAFQKELSNLLLLVGLKHPNIVQLYCSYIHRQKQNFIFALAEGGTLEDMLCGKIKGPTLSHTLLALADLASAIDALHDFTSKTLGAHLAGCHHDLAPRNILVHKDTFLLADFGLSTFRNIDEGSLTTFKQVRGAHVAPECQILHDGRLETQKIGRASDIWSFGCILVEVLTYMLQGTDAVNRFRELRKTEILPNIAWSRFHQGAKISNPAVELWLHELQANEEPYCGRMLKLIRAMLSLDPDLRPRSARVLMILRGTAVISLVAPIQQLLKGTSAMRPNIDHMLSNMRFRGWLLAFDQLLNEAYHGDVESLQFDFVKMRQALQEMHDTLQSIAWDTADGKPQQQPLLRYQYTRLVEALPPSYRSTAKEHLVRLIMDFEDVQKLGDLSTAIRGEEDEDIGRLIAAKHLTVLAEQGLLAEQMNLIINQKDITMKEDIGIHTLAEMQSTRETVLVEWLRYKGSWADEVIGPELHRRLGTIIGLLHSESITKIPGSLSCKGAFLDQSHGAFGVIYSLPPLVGKPVTLHWLLDEGKHRCPPLEQRFQLAHDICQCIHTFHKIGWLHRNLHSKNIMFFPPKEANDCGWVRDPRILGFGASRENDFSSYTDGPESGQLRDYQQPEYLSYQARYREEFDFYSIGMILLEIGFWKPLSKITDSHRFQDVTSEQFRQQVLETRVPGLRNFMGTRYMEVTRRCLEGSFADQRLGAGDARASCHVAFENEVIDQIPLIN
ncbi:hypothetical protein S40288_09977 [Stachybotrys chartarum IBT 40288]|nr:hypothetical protein S40288_09977 [Stachybotrys chartarum IBT 40288]